MIELLLFSTCKVTKRKDDLKMEKQEFEQNEKLQIEIYTNLKSDKDPEVFNSEYDAARFLKNRFKKRIENYDQKWFDFSINDKIIISIGYTYDGIHSCGSQEPFKNELEGIEYLKSLFVKRLWEKAI